MKNSMIKVMIAGIGGASLGTEIYKALKLSGGYQVYGCDVSPTAYGLYDSGFIQTYRIDIKNYVQNVISSCVNSGAKWLIPGGEQPMELLGAAADKLKDAGIKLVSNSPEIIDLFSDKEKTFKKLSENGISIPKTVVVNKPEDIEFVGLPCIIKPATGSGGSVSVFFIKTIEEGMIYANYIQRGGAKAIAQEYIDIDEGEFTVGVLSLQNRHIAGSIALRRELNAKLSVAYRGRGGVVSSGYSQGYIDEFPEICKQAECIANIIGSQGPINIQGRIRDGVLMPFEINPRFSASTYLRALAGFNEVDLMIKYDLSRGAINKPSIKPGWYLRSLDEIFVPKGSLK